MCKTVSIVIFNRALLLGIQLNMILSLGRQMLGLCPTNLLQQLEGICLEPIYLFIVILHVSPNNKIELANPSSSPAMVMKLLRQTQIIYWLKILQYVKQNIFILSQRDGSDTKLTIVETMCELRHLPPASTWSKT